MTVSPSSDRSPGRPRRDDLMSRTAIMRVLACLSTMLAQPAYAVPVMTGAQASGGGPVVTSDHGVTGVALHSPRTLITWSSFDVGQGDAALLIPVEGPFVCNDPPVRLAAAVRVTIYLANFGDFATVNRIMQEFFSEPYPARVTIGAAALPRGAAIEVDCILVP